MTLTELLIEVDWSFGFFGSVNSQCTMVEDELFNTQPVAHVEQLSCRCVPAEFGDLPGCSVLENLDSLQQVALTTSPQRKKISQDRHEDSICC